MLYYDVKIDTSDWRKPGCCIVALGIPKQESRLGEISSLLSERHLIFFFFFEIRFNIHPLLHDYSLLHWCSGSHHGALPDFM